MKNKGKTIKYFILLLLVGLLFLPTSISKYEMDDNEIILADASNTPKLITPYYNTNHFIVADYVLSPSSGDMTSSIQSALNKCNSAGGGTVWLERGIYNVSSPITIPSACTLMGDWQDPDNYQGTLDYGTKIVVDVNTFKSDNTNLEDTGLFKMKSSSGLEGITIYYKNQNLNSPKVQPWSIYYTSWQEDWAYVGVSIYFTVRNVTMINSYRGIGRYLGDKFGHASLIIENVKGTILKSGLVVHTSYDVGTITGLSFKPKYWASANLKAFNDNSSNSSEGSIINAVKNNGGIGMTLTKVDLSQYEDIELSGFKYGIYVPSMADTKVITEGSGSVSFYNLNISNCNMGIYVSIGSKNNTTMILSYGGYLITKGSIEGSEYAIFNDSDVVTVNGKKYRGTIKLNDVSIKGKVWGTGSILYYDTGSKSYKEASRNVNLTGDVNNTGKFSDLNHYRKLKNDGTNFTYLNAGSSVDQINSAVSSISSKGGGVVYLRPGKYTIDGPITIPANVELRGSSAVVNRNFTLGTIFVVSFSKKENFRAINISADNSGISGINIIYPDTIKNIIDGTSYKYHDYAVVIQGSKNNYVRSVTLASESYGVYFNYASNFTIENIAGCAVYNFVRADNSSNGVIKNVLANANVITYSRYYNHSSATNSSKYSDATVKNLKFIHLVNSSDIEIDNCFPFRANTFLKTENSNFYAVNMTHDDSEIGSKYMIENSKSNGVIVNALKWSKCNNIDNTKNSNIGIYNAYRIKEVGENDTFNSIFKVSKKYIVPVLKTDSSVVFNKLSKKEIDYYYDGDGKVSCKSSNESVVKCSISGKKVVITPVTNGQANVTVSASGGIHYSSITTSINVSVNTGTGSGNGDIDGDNKVTTNDYILIRKYILNTTKLTNEQLKRADANGDGKVNSADYISIRKIILKGGNVEKSTPQPIPSDTTPPTINSWTSTSLSHTSVSIGTSTTTICNLGSDVGDGLKTIEYYTDCTGTKTANIGNNCATITINNCANGKLYYRLKDNYNYSSLNTINDIGKYLIFAQVYNKLLYPGSGALNDNSNLGYWVLQNKIVSSNVREIGEIAITKRTGDSNETFIKYLYQGVVGRDADASGLNYWVGELNKGTPRKTALDGFVISNEAKGIYASWGYN